MNMDKIALNFILVNDAFRMMLIYCLIEIFGMGLTLRDEGGNAKIFGACLTNLNIGG